MGNLLGEKLAEAGADGGGGRPVGGPQIGGVGHGGVLGIEPHGRGIEQTETFGGDAGDDFSGNAAPRSGFADDKEASGAGHGGEDGVGVEGLDGAEVDDFDLPTFLDEIFGRLQ